MCRLRRQGSFPSVRRVPTRARNFATFKIRQKMNLLVLGASGGIGRWVVQLAAAKDHRVRALVRPATAYEAPAGVEVLRGEALDPGVLQNAVAGMDAVVSCLGQRRASQNPWSPLLSPRDLMTRLTPSLITAMRRAGVRRLVAVSAGGVAESIEQLTSPTRWLVRQGQIAVAYCDLATMEQTLAASDLDWLAVRPVTLVNGPPNGGAREVDRYRFTSTVRRSEVAAWMLGAVESESPFRQRTVLLGQ
jgi:uncharacterized protein YbjT (DUF2867 family)